MVSYLYFWFHFVTAKKALNRRKRTLEDGCTPPEPHSLCDTWAPLPIIDGNISLPSWSITTLHDRIMFSSKPSTLGFKGSAIKSCTLLSFLFVTWDGCIRAANDYTIHCRAQGPPSPPVSDRISSRHYVLSRKRNLTKCKAWRWSDRKGAANVMSSIRKEVNDYFRCARELLRGSFLPEWLVRANCWRFQTWIYQLPASGCQEVPGCA